MPMPSSQISENIERGFDLRARHPTHLDYKSRWVKESAATRSRLDCTVDVSCGQHTEMTFDIFPARPLPSPCFVFFHGGFWRSSDKSESSFIANTFEGSGITAVIMNYRLAPTVSIPEIIKELQKSMVSLYHNAGQFGIDQENIHVGGFSAGGLLAAHIRKTDWTSFGIRETIIQSGMALSGIFDPHPLISTSHNRVLGLTLQQADALNVITPDQVSHVLEFVACGDAETSEFKNQTRRYVDATQNSGQSTRELWIKDRHHYDVVLDYASFSSELAITTRETILNAS